MTYPQLDVKKVEEMFNMEITDTVVITDVTPTSFHSDSLTLNKENVADILQNSTREYDA